MPLKPNNVGNSPQKAIRIANTCTFTLQKHQKTKDKNSNATCKAKLKTDATRQAKIVGDSYITASARPPRYMNYYCISIKIKHDFQSDAHRLAIHITPGHPNNNFCLRNS